MGWRDNSDQLIPVNQGINMRNTTFEINSNNLTWRRYL
jgi:hypothetical protein